VASVREMLIVGCGGFAGAVARFALSGWVQQWSGARFPAGTFVVNLVGCCALGAFMTAAQERLPLAPETRLFVTLGFLGSFTTFSTFGYETLALLRAGDLGRAAVNVVGQVVLGVLAVALGGAAVRVLWR
jgi:CrcB protein